MCVVCFTVLVLSSSTNLLTFVLVFHCIVCLVQSPKGDISYLQKFFLMYVGGRQPLHFQEDFCGTALLRCVFHLMV